MHPRIKPIVIFVPAQRGGLRLITRPLALAALLAVAVGTTSTLTPTVFAQGQGQSPIYVDDSPAASEALQRAGELAGVGNLAEAAGVLQKVLDEFGDTVIADPSASDPDVFIPVRRRVHEILLSNPPLLERYRALNIEQARRSLDAGQEEAVERQRLLTPSGFDAALLLAQDHFEFARFDAALIALEQLEHHPDRKDDRARQAAEMLTRLARYAHEGVDSTLWAWSDRWRNEAGLAANPDHSPAPRPATPVARDPFSGAQSISLDGMLPRPLASDTIGEPNDAIAAMSVSVPTRGVPESALVLHAAPTVSGDTVYVNDGERLSAWDRFTLTLKWRRRIDTEINQGQQVYSAPAMLEDMSRIVISEPWAVATTGFSLLGRPSPERTITVLNARTGDPAWSRTVLQMSPTFEDSMLRGAPIVDQGTVVAAVLKQSQQRRLVSISLVGLDLATGDTRWIRTLGSIGALPWGTWRFGGGDEATSQNGIVYRTDRLGVITAVEIWTGRVRWLRRIMPEPATSTFAAGVPQWSAQQPLLHRGRLFTLSPDRRFVLVLDQSNGSILRQLQCARLGQPDYLLLSGDLLLAVSASRVMAIDLSRDDWTEMEPLSIAEVIGSGLRGRAVVTGEQLILPIAEGLRVIELARVRQQIEAKSGTPTEYGRIVPLESPGTALPLESQVLVVDDSRIHSYLLWDVAESLLHKRMTENPADAEAPITYAELSYQARRFDHVLPAVDKALAAIERDPLSPTSDRSRSRLFRTLLEIVEPSTPLPSTASLSETLKGELVDRLARAAAQPAEQVASLLAGGRFAEATRQPQLAVDRYQQILDTPALTSETYTARQTTVPADVEATRRLRDLIRREGATVYGVYEQEAARRLDELGSGAAGEQYETLAKRFPLASVSPRAWSFAADRYMAEGRTELGLFALEEGARTAVETLSASDPLAGQLATKLVLRLRDAGRIIPAIRALETMQRDQPGLRLTNESGSLDSAVLLRELRTELAKQHPRPRIGVDLAQAVPIMGWSIVEPICTPTPDCPTDLVMMGSSEGELALFRIKSGGESSRLWSVAPRETFLYIDGTSAYFGKPLSDNNGLPDQILIARDLATGQQRWSTLPVRASFEKDPRFPDPRRVEPIDTPLRSNSRYDDMSVLFDNNTLIILERTGRCKAIDLKSGAQLWSLPPIIGRVHDVAMRNGVMIVGGADEIPGLRSPVDVQLRPVMIAMEARTGRILRRQEEDAAIRWVRTTPEGLALIGHDNGIALLDVFRRTSRWRNDSPQLARSVEAWATHTQIVVRDNQNDLWGVNAETGERSAAAIDTHGRMDPDFRRVDVEQLGERTVVSTLRGFALLDASGKLVGADSRPGEMLSLLPALTQTLLVTIEHADESDIDSTLSRFRLSLYGSESGKLEMSAEVVLPTDPMSLACVDGAILISAGTATLVIPAPSAPTP